VRPFVLLALGAAAAIAAAQAERRGEALRHEGVIAAPPAAVYASLTTAEGVQRAWGVARAKVDFRLGGSYRTAYDAKTDLDGPDAIVNTILAFEPDRMIALAAARRAREQLETLCGGEWTATLPVKDGAPMSARTRWSRRLEGRFLVAEGWLGAQDAMHEHGHLVIGVDPASGASTVTSRWDRCERRATTASPSTGTPSTPAASA